MLLWAPGFARILALAGTWTACEWLRGHLFTGFPWNGLGYAFAGSDILAQSASLWGVYGLGFAVVLITAAPATLADDHPLERQTATRRWAGPAVMFATVSALAAYGYLRLADAQLVAVDGVRVRIVQPNVPQAEKWLPDNQNRIFARFLELSNQATSPETMGIDDVTHLIWPESALPFLLASRPDALAAIAALLPDGTQLVTGALRRGDASAPTGRPHVFNSILVIDSQGQVIATYDKEHLVPFGEYLPFESVLAPLGLRKLVTLPLGFEAGPGRKTIADAAGPRFSPLICYEVIFPGAVADAAERPGWLLNVTNDAWFGSSIGPHQHFQQARMRAIEEGLPLARAANTGISAVVDPYGRVLKSLALGTSGVLDSRLPSALPPTLYVRFRDLPVLVLVLIALACALSARVAGGRVDNAVTRRSG
jgi:apolipoprotein N-acyltransferase